MKKPLAALCLILSINGCASLSNDDRQVIRVETFTEQGDELLGAQCKFNNEKSSFNFTSPAKLTIMKAIGPATIECRFNDFPVAKGTLIASSDGFLIASRLFDQSRDKQRATAYQYPHWIRLTMGQQSNFDASSDATGTPSNAQPADKSPSTDTNTTTEPKAVSQ